MGAVMVDVVVLLLAVVAFVVVSVGFWLLHDGTHFCRCWLLVGLCSCCSAVYPPEELPGDPW